MSESTSTNRLQYERQHEIYLLALRNGSVEVADLANRFNVTTETIRRDLSELQAREQVRRVHGGAVLLERVNHEPRLAARDMQNATEKLRMAQAAIAEIPATGSVLIDSGSTLQRLADVFPSDRDVHVVTNSLVIAATLARRGISPLTMLGGDIRTNTLAAVDAFTVDMVRSLAVDVLFISCDGFSFRRGLTTPYRAEAMVKRAMIEAAQRVVAIVDFSKFGNGQLFAYADPDDIDMLITDDRADDDTIESLRAHDLDVRVA
jgi:DeoR family transcriptional regulator, fructose operon transcriptional repressor